MLNLSAPIQTRSGKPARFLAQIVSATPGKSYVFVIGTEDNKERVVTRFSNGHRVDDARERSDDIINTPTIATQYEALADPVKQLVIALIHANQCNCAAIALSTALNIAHSQAYDFVHSTLR